MGTGIILLITLIALAAKERFDKDRVVRDYLISLFSIWFGPLGILFGLSILAMTLVSIFYFICLLIPLIIPGLPGCVAYIISFESKALSFIFTRNLIKDINKCIFGLTDEDL